MATHNCRLVIASLHTPGGSIVKKQRGFTLIELMVVVAIVAILAGIAFNAYTNQIRKSRRAEAKQVLSDMALREEKFRSNNASYGTTAASPTGIGLPATANYYTVTLTVGSNTANPRSHACDPSTGPA